MDKTHARVTTSSPRDQWVNQAPFRGAMTLASRGIEVPPLSEECREVLPTAVAAFHLNRKPQTLRVWAMDESGPLRPIRVFGKLGWRTADIKRLLGVAK